MTAKRARELLSAYVRRWGHCISHFHRQAEMTADGKIVWMGCGDCNYTALGDEGDGVRLRAYLDQQSNTPAKKGGR